ncbi:MAG: hypothetical protein Q8O95_04445 [bacterium]|nr:hypothetical protein [bacterium]
MSDDSQTHQHHEQCQDKKQHCHCCGPTEFEFPEELMIPELTQMRKDLGEEAFLEMMKAMM